MPWGKQARFLVSPGPGSSTSLEAALSGLPRVLQERFHLLGARVLGTVEVVDYAGPVSGLDDGSPSTIGVDGRYRGEWDAAAGRPHGRGVMEWENGIRFSGEWKDGAYHGTGSKVARFVQATHRPSLTPRAGNGQTYSRGGGYTGEWREGKRQGWGTSFYNGKWGYDRWEGPFEDDLPHGEGASPHSWLEP